MVIRLGSTVINCADLELMTGFWSQALHLVPSSQAAGDDFGNPDHAFPPGSMGAFSGGTMAAFGTVRVRSEADPVHDMRYWGGVHPAWRRRGLGRRLLDWAEDAAVRLHQEHFPGQPYP